MTSEEQLKYGSHLPALLACIGETSDDVENRTVLELGIGHFSTPQLHALCGALSIQLISIEEESNWVETFLKLKSKNHQIIWGEYKKELERLVGLSRMASLTVSYNFLVSFIDHSPGGKSRADAFKALLPISEYVVVHDMQKEDENWEHISPMLTPEVKWHLCETYFPSTLVASLTREVPKSILCL